MLSSLTIRDIVLIDALSLEFSEGLSALTGETGAGKSILLGALNLACGARAERAQIRAGAQKAVITALFEPSPDHDAYTHIAEAGLEIEPGEPIILRRSLTADGRSKAHVNDQPSSVALLSLLGDALVEIHGQHDGRGLMNPKTHLDLLDSYAGLKADRNTVSAAYSQWHEARNTLEALKISRDKAASEEAFLRESVEVLEDLAPQAGEEAQLASERKFLQHAESALQELQKALVTMMGGEGLSIRLNAALRGLETVRGNLVDAEEGVAGQARQSVDCAVMALERALIEFNEAEQALSDAAEQFDIEPGRLEIAEERLFALRAIARKHSVEIEQLLSLKDRLRAELDMIEHADDRYKEAQAALVAAEADYAKTAKILTKSRKEASLKLAKAVEAELVPLKMGKARFQVRIASDETHPGKTGWDKVLFEVSTNPGAPFGPLDKIASGGELSRFGLALKVCLYSGDNKTMVFDEVDQGVGGAVADAVGERLLRLAQTGQTLVVTHSPQVAAKAIAHFRIEKSENTGVVRTHVVELDKDERREEIARMLSGAHVNDAARAAADQLMTG